VPPHARALAARAPGVRAAGRYPRRILSGRRSAYALLAALAALPRLAVVLYERDDITSAFVDKGDDFAVTFLESGTYGFIPDVPSAYTQPLYGWFLIPLYWVFERSWLTVGLAQIAVAVVTAWLVYEIGRRVVSAPAGLVAAGLAAAHPYLVWHDVHMNREILDGALAAAVVLLALVAAERRSLPLAAALGAVVGVAILGNVRLVLLPVVVAAYLLWRGRRPALPGALVAVAAAALVVAPWVVRNSVSVGCAALTTDGRALWKANNVNTLETLRDGRWIDDVPPLRGAPFTPQETAALYESTGRVVRVDECAQMRFYRERALEFVRDHPGEKAQLAGIAAMMLWQPAVTKTEGRRDAGTWLDTGRTWVEPVFMIALYGLALGGVLVLPRWFTVLAVALLAYTTLAAMAFAGETRYRVPWDFLTAVAASAALVALARRFAPAGWGARLSPTAK
jgi:4-amino-4-deoxy-L-arabinose transferase-like glycosyltransferase